MSNEDRHLQARHYRRGTILGLTLAELLMLLLFLFLLVMSIVITERDDRISLLEQERERIEEERLAWRNGVAEATSIQLPNDSSFVLTEEELDRPIEDLRRLQQDSDAFREIADEGLTATELIQLLEQDEILEEFVGISGASTRRELLDRLRSILGRARALRPGQDSITTIGDGLEELGSGLESCIWKPNGSVAYSFVVTLTPEGVRVEMGDPEAFAAEWIGSPALPQLHRTISVTEFNRTTLEYYATGDTGAPVERSTARRPCRFYIQLQRSRRLVDVDRYEQMVQRVQQNFFRSFQIDIVD